MDRLQAAIEKARTARQSVLADMEKSAPSNDNIARVSRPRVVSVQDAIHDTQLIRQTPWDKLGRAEIDPRVLARSRVVTREAGPKTAPFDVLRTRVTQLMSDKGWRRLCITSPGPECGKSTVTLNLAFSLARQPDLRVVVVDLDLRRPSLATMLGFSGTQRISRAIEGRTPLADQMLRVGSNLAFVTESRPVKNPSEMLQSRKMRALLEQLDAEYTPDVVLFDLPPMMVSDDAIGFSPLVDCALLIAAAEHSTIKQVDTCEQELAGRTNVLGVVLNKCEHPGESYGYGYGYGYGESA